MKHSQIVIVGSGIAALAAAARIVETQPASKVTIVTKGLGGTPYIAAFNAVLPDGPYEDTPERYCDDMLNAGYGINDRALIRAFAQELPDCLAMLERWGIRFSSSEKYRYLLRRASGSSCPRSLCRDDKLVGLEMVEQLMPKLKERGVCFREHCECTGLLRDDAGIAGVCVRDLKSGAVENLYARCVIAGWGGVGNLYRDTTYPADIDGRALAMAYAVGAQLIDLEFVEFEPMVCLAPPAIKGEPCPTAMLGEGGHLLNNEGQRFLLAVRPEGEAGAPKTLINNAISQEVEAGRGTPEGGVYADLRHLDEERLKAYPWFYQRLKNAGVDPKRQLLLVGPIAHSHSGGMEIDSYCETNVPGLFAVGEAAGGMHGACRMAGNASTQAAVSGYVAGDAVAQRDIAPYCGPELPAAFIEDVALKERYGDAIRNILWEYVNRKRDADGLKTALKQIEEILPATAGDTATHQLATSARLLILAALAREESRGTHNRTDYPQKDPAFQCSLRLQQASGQTTIEKIERV